MGDTATHPRPRHAALALVGVAVASGFCATVSIRALAGAPVGASVAVAILELLGACGLLAGARHVLRAEPRARFRELDLAEGVSVDAPAIASGYRAPDVDSRIVRVRLRPPRTTGVATPSPAARTSSSGTSARGSARAT